MYDTVIMACDRLEDATVEAIQSQLQAKWGVNAGTGELDYLVYAGKIAVGNGALVNISIKRSKWLMDSEHHTPRKVATPPTIYLEVSLHKAMLGHNVWGGPTLLHAACKWFLGHMEGQLDCLLPSWSLWRLRRVDVAEVFDLGSEEAVMAWLEARKLTPYPRRLVHWYGNRGFLADGTNTTLRAYAKGPEFRTTSQRGLYRLMQPHEVHALADQACRYLRIEVHCKRGLLDSLSTVEPPTPPFIPLVEDVVLAGVYDREWHQFMRENELQEGIVRTALEVRSRLQEHYDYRRVGPLYGTWCMLAVSGETAVRELMGSSTFRRHRALLESAGVSWLGSDVQIGDAPSIPIDFIPHFASRYRVTATHPTVADLEAQYA